MVVLKENLEKIDITKDIWEDDIIFARFSASEKSKKERLYNKFREKRSSFEKFINLFPGDLAKNIVRKNIKDMYGLELVDYDKIRTDNFENNDPWDLKWKDYEIEVKSSIEKYNSSINNILENRRIIVFENKGIKDIIIQVFFVYKDDYGKKIARLMGDNKEQEFINEGIRNIDEFIKIFRQHFTAIIAGFITKDEACSNKGHLTFTKRGECSRNYKNHFIMDSNSMDELVKKII